MASSESEIKESTRHRVQVSIGGWFRGKASISHCWLGCISWRSYKPRWSCSGTTMAILKSTWAEKSNMKSVSVVSSRENRSLERRNMKQGQMIRGRIETNCFWKIRWNGRREHLFTSLWTTVKRLSRQVNSLKKYRSINEVPCLHFYDIEEASQIIEKTLDFSSFD